MSRTSFLQLCFISILLWFGNLKPASSQFLTDSAQVYLLTASWGDDPSSAFGHSAIRVLDPSHQFDSVYGYGTYDFNAPNFYLKFTTGQLMYFLSKMPYDQFLDEYQSQGQALFEQKFSLTNKEKWTLISNLEVNYLPDNKYYRYDFFHDNCATRIRDIIEKSVDGSLVYDSSYVKKPLTFRQLIRPNYANVPWLNFGIDIVFGTVTDEKATVKGYMFLPEHMMSIYNKTKIVSTDTIRPLIASCRELFPSRLVFEKPSALSSPSAFFDFLFVLFIGLTVVGQLKKRQNRWVDFVLFFLIGILGLLLVFLMFASLHEELWHNFNVVWASPICLLISIGALLRIKTTWFRFVLLIYLISLTVFIPVSFILPQEIPTAAFPIIGILWLRSIVLLKNLFFPNQKWLFLGV